MSGWLFLRMMQLTQAVHFMRGDFLGFWLALFLIRQHAFKLLNKKNKHLKTHLLRTAIYQSPKVLYLVDVDGRFEEEFLRL